MPAKDLKGQRFGRLLVGKSLGVNQHQKQIWECQCDCGKIKEVLSGSLTSGNTKSCGCYNRDKISERSRKDLKGQRFGRLVALKSIKSDKYNNRIWECRCDCGGIKDIISRNLINGDTKSCGCYNLDTSRDKINKYNDRHWQDLDEHSSLQFTADQLNKMKMDAKYREDLK